MHRYDGIYRKRQFLPIWILQSISAGFFAVIACLLLAAAAYINDNSITSNYTYYGYTSADLEKTAAITGGVLLAFALITIIFDIIEAILYAKRSLNPVVLLVFACLKTLVWGIFFSLTMVGAATRSGGTGILDIIFALILVATSITQLVFGAKYTHQKRRGDFSRGNYKPTVNVEAGTASTYYDGPPLPTAYDPSVRAPSPTPSYGAHPDAAATNYHSQGLELLPPKGGHY